MLGKCKSRLECLPVWTRSLAAVIGIVLGIAAAIFVFGAILYGLGLFFDAYINQDKIPIYSPFWTVVLLILKGLLMVCIIIICVILLIGVGYAFYFLKRIYDYCYIQCSDMSTETFDRLDNQDPELEPIPVDIPYENS